MSEYIPSDEMYKFIDCRYTGVVVTARRARQLMMEDPTNSQGKPLLRAFDDLMDGKLHYQFMEPLEYEEAFPTGIYEPEVNETVTEVTDEEALDSLGSAIDAATTEAELTTDETVSEEQVQPLDDIAAASSIEQAVEEGSEIEVQVAPVAEIESTPKATSKGSKRAAKGSAAQVIAESPPEVLATTTDEDRTSRTLVDALPEESKAKPKSRKKAKPD